MSEEVAGCTFTAEDGGWSFSVSRYCGPASLGADRQMVQVRFASLGRDEEVILQMRPLEFRRMAHSCAVAGSWLQHGGELNR